MMIDYVMPASNQVPVILSPSLMFTTYTETAGKWAMNSVPIDASSTDVVTIKYSMVVGDSQRTIQAVLEIVLIALVPIFLCVKPCIVKFSHNHHVPHADHVQVHTESIQYEKNPEGKGITRNEKYEQI